MSLPGNVDVVRVRGYWFAQAGGGSGLPVLFEPAVSNLTDTSAFAYIKTSAKTAMPDTDSAYFFVDLIASDDPDLTPSAWKVTPQGQPSFTVAVAYDSPVEEVDTGVFMKAMWLVNAPTITPPPAPVDTYYTSTQTNTLLTGKAAAGVPAHAGVRSGRFDPSRSVYNLAARHVGKLRTALAEAHTGDGVCRVQFIGDSLTAGAGATPGTTDAVNWFRTAVAHAGYRVGCVVHPANGTTLDTRMANSGWTLGSSTAVWASVSGSGHTLTLNTDTPGTVLEIVTTGVTAAFTYSVDGDSPVAVIPSGLSALQTITVTGLTDTTHTIVITSVTGTNYVISVGVYPDTGVVLGNAGFLGTTAADWDTTGYNAGIQLALTPNPDFVVLELGINDYNASVDPATFTVSLESLVDKVRTAGAELLLVGSHLPDDSGDFDAYLSAIYDVADAKNVPLLDLGDAFGAYAAWSVLGIQASGIHLNHKGYARKAANWAEAILRAGETGGETVTGVHRVSGLFGVNRDASPRQPINMTSVVDGSSVGADDKVSIAFAPAVTGDFTGATGSNPTYWWGLNVFATTGAKSGDGDGLTNIIGSLLEASIQTQDVTIPYVAGAQVEAAFFGADTNAVVTQMESLRVSAPKRKDGATGGVATNSTCLFIESPESYDVGQSAQFALNVEGGVSRLGGRVDVQNVVLSFAGELVLRGDYSGAGSINLTTDNIGFFGATPVAQQTLPSSGSVTAADIRTALINLGLCL